MKIEGTYTFEAPLAVVWKALFDAEVLAKTLPGCDGLVREGNQFKGDINVKMGPVQGKFQGKVDVTDLKEPESYTMVVDGRGPAGFGKATAHIKLAGDGGTTVLSYDSDVQVGGRVASVGQRLLDASTRAIVKQSLDGLHAQIKVLAAQAAASPASDEFFDTKAAARPEPAALDAQQPEQDPLAANGERGPEWFPARAEPVAPARVPVRAPSQVAFAMGVAKEVTKELLPLRTVLLVLGLLVVAWAIYRNVTAG